MKKYRNCIVGEDGLPFDKARHKERFDSKREYHRWCELKLLQDAGIIRNLFRQEPYRMELNGVKLCKYIADFTYDDNDGKVVEDVKGCVTAVFRLKAKLMMALHGIRVKVTK